MKSWILNVIGVIFLGVILEIILPESKITTFIKHIFSVFLLFVIISPITKLSIDENLFVSNNVVTDTNFIYEVNIQKVEALTNDIKNSLEKNNIKNAQVVIYSDVFSEEFNVSNVYVDITKTDYELNNELSNKIKKIVLDVVGINEDEVFIYGR